VDLDKAMVALAHCVSASASGHSEALTAGVRAALLGLEAGRPVANLSLDQHHQIVAWLQGQRGVAVDLPGQLYEAMLGRVVIAGKNGFEVRTESAAHRSTGAYYTGEPVVRYMVRRAAELGCDIQQVLDPACGSGAFLQGASEVFPRDVRLVGFESDPTSAAICASRLPNSQVHVLDTLTAQVDERFDLVLGNPPYISHGLRGAPPMSAEVHKALRALYPLTAAYKLNTYPLFIERGLQLLRPGGILGYIVPDSFLTGRYFVGLRQILLANRILEITLIQQDFWRHGRVGQSVVLFVQKQASVLTDHVMVRICKSLDDLEDSFGSQVRQSDLQWGEQKRFRLVPQSQDRQFLASVDTSAGTQPGRELFLTYSGLIARAGQESLLWTPNSAGTPGRLLRSGRQVDRYSTQWHGHEVNLDPGLFKSGYKPSNYQNPKLFMRQTAESLRVSFDDQGYYCLNNIHLILPKRGVHPRTLLAIFNSRLLNRYYALVTMESGRLFPQVDLDLIRELPFPSVHGRQVPQLTELTLAREKVPQKGEAQTQIEAAIDRLVEQSYGLI